MNREQTVHVGMINSFNVITGRSTVEKIINSGIGILAHPPDEEVDHKLIKFMIEYFQNLEMFERCVDLKAYYDKNFNEDGTPKFKVCECTLPEIKSYDAPVHCSNCNKRIIR